MKTDKLIIKAFNNLGYNSGDCKTKSDLMLMITDAKEALSYAIDKIEEMADLQTRAKAQIEILEEIENEYEKEYLRKINPNRTIY